MWWQLLAIYEVKKAARELDEQQKAYERDLLRDEQMLHDSMDGDASSKTSITKTKKQEKKSQPHIVNDSNKDGGKNDYKGCMIVLWVILLVIASIKFGEYYQDNHKEYHAEPAATGVTYSDTVTADTSEIAEPEK